MKKDLAKIEGLLQDAIDHFQCVSDELFAHKPEPHKWSPKEILGHLIDSAINNLQRFTEIQFVTKSYVVRAYDQDALVKANAYQKGDVQTLVQLWVALNHQILWVIEYRHQEILDHPIVLPNGDVSTLAFLITDYAHHMEHHLKQIKTYITL